MQEKCNKCGSTEKLLKEKTTEESFDINNLIKNIKEMKRITPKVKKIKMKESFYKKLEQEVLKLNTSRRLKCTETLINKITGVPIKIDNEIKNDYEVEYE